ncbi:hypothetical protein LKK83_05495 [Phormidium sp. CCY1219]|nr:hypothetical protein [Phormidium sp. CCY1219]
MVGITLVDLPVGGSQEEGGGWLPYVCSGAIAEQLCTSNYAVANRFPL